MTRWGALGGGVVLVLWRPAFRALAGAPGQDLGQAVPWQSRGAMATAAGHVLVGDQGIGHGLLRRLDDGFEERIEVAPRDEGELVVPGVVAGPRGAVARETARIRGREGEENVARGVRAAGACPGQARGDPSGEGLALAGEERGVGGHDDDHRARPWRSEVRHAAHRVVLGEFLPEVDAIEGELVPAAEVRLEEDADGVSGVTVVDQS